MYLTGNSKTYHPTLHFTPCSLDLFIRVPFQLHRGHIVPQPFRRIDLIVHNAISALPGTHFHPSQVKHLMVKYLAQGHNIKTMSQGWKGRNVIFLWKSCTKRGFKPHTVGSDIGRAPRSNNCALSLFSTLEIYLGPPSSNTLKLLHLFDVWRFVLLTQLKI